MIVRLLAAFALLALGLAHPSSASAEARVALVIGNASYETGQLPTTANDAGLMVENLRAAGFDVVAGADLDLAGLRRSVREFLDKLESAGPDAAALVYLGGHGLQFEGENFMVPVGARIDRASDIPFEAFRLNDLVRSMAAVPARARFVMLDLGRRYAPLRDGAEIAPGLVLVDPPNGFLVSYSTAPDLVFEDGQDAYGAYASAFVEMMRVPGLGPDELFAKLRVRVHELTGGRQTPWDVARLTEPFSFFEPDPSAPAPPPEARIPSRPQRAYGDLGPDEAYAIAIERDTIPAYQEFLRYYPDVPLSARVKRVLAIRREAVIWQRTLSRNTPEAYWTYLRRYPDGPHAWDARRRLSRLTAPIEPPLTFVEEVYDVPPPLVGVEIIRPSVWYVEDYFPPPPPPPIYLLPPRQPDYYLPPPPPYLGAGFLPLPIPVPVPIWARRPPPPPPPVVIPGRPIPVGGFVPGGPRPPRPGTPVPGTPIPGAPQPGGVQPVPVPGAPLPGGQVQGGPRPPGAPQPGTPTPGAPQPGGVQPVPVPGAPLPGGQVQGGPRPPGAPLTGSPQPAPAVTPAPGAAMPGQIRPIPAPGAVPVVPPAPGINRPGQIAPPRGPDVPPPAPLAGQPGVRPAQPGQDRLGNPVQRPGGAMPAPGGLQNGAVRPAPGMNADRPTLAPQPVRPRPDAQFNRPVRPSFEERPRPAPSMQRPEPIDRYGRDIRRPGFDPYGGPRGAPPPELRRPQTAPPPMRMAPPPQAAPPSMRMAPPPQAAPPPMRVAPPPQAAPPPMRMASPPQAAPPPQRMAPPPQAAPRPAPPPQAAPQRGPPPGQQRCVQPNGQPCR